MRIEPLGDKIVVKRMDAEEVTAGGILLPDSAQEKDPRRWQWSIAGRRSPRRISG